MSRLARISLISLPQWNPTHPTLAIPMLLAYLRRHGVNVTARDFNIEFYDWLLCPSRIEHVTSSDLARFNSYHVQPTLTESEWDTYRSLGRDYLCLDHVLSNLESAVQYFRSPSGGTYNVLEYAHARAVIDAAMRLVSKASHGRLSMNWEGIRLPQQDRISTGIANLASTVLGEFLQERVIPHLCADAPEVLGISVCSPVQYLCALFVAERFKAIRPDSFVVIGGAFTSAICRLLTESIEPHRNVDAYVVHEGEKPLLQLLESLSGQGRLESVPNLVYWQDGKSNSTPSVSAVPLGEVGAPDFSDLPLDKYFAPARILPILSYRGCYFGKCSFCTHHHSYLHTDPWRDIDTLAGHLSDLSDRYSTEMFYFVDECIHIPNMRGLARALKRRECKIEWFASARLEAPLDSAETVYALRESGCRMLIFGLESGNTRVLQAMRKGYTAEQAESVLKRVHDYGIITATMQFIGFPTETREEAQDTFEFLSRNRPIIDLGARQMGLFSLNEGSPVANSPENFQILNVELKRYSDSIEPLTRYDTGAGMSCSEAAALARKFAADNRCTIDYAYLITDRPHALFVDPSVAWNCQFFSSTEKTMDVRLGNAGLHEFTPRLVPGTIVGRLRNSCDSRVTSMRLANLISQRHFRIDEHTRQFLDELDGNLSLGELLVSDEDSAWTRQLLTFLASEGFLCFADDARLSITIEACAS